MFAFPQVNRIFYDNHECDSKNTAIEKPYLMFTIKHQLYLNKIVYLELTCSLAVFCIADLLVNVRIPNSLALAYISKVEIGNL